MKFRTLIALSFRCWLLPVLGCCVALSSYAQDFSGLSFSSNLIPDSLRQGANSVVRIFEQDFVVKSPDKATLDTHYVITLLNENAADYLKLELPYDKFTKIEDVRISLYDSTGKVMVKYKKKDMVDQAATDDETLAGDQRELDLALGTTGYPMTIEVETQYTQTALTRYPQWDILDPDQSLQIGELNNDFLAWILVTTG